ncbi:MAG: hypothetical protein PF508_19475 [Spirochaeta sp.]|nr:hypothetical protein [Spirochaeta sp.]
MRTLHRVILTAAFLFSGFTIFASGNPEVVTTGTGTTVQKQEGYTSAATFSVADTPEWIDAEATERGITATVYLADGRRVVVDHHRDGAGVVGEPVVQNHRNIDTLQAPLVIGDATFSVGNTGTLTVTRNGSEQILSDRLLPDARVHPLGQTGVVALSDPTDSYPHGIMGDALEARSFTVVRLVSGTDDTARRYAVDHVPLAVEGVMETVEPVVADVAPPPGPELIVPVSTDRGGTRVVVVTPDGTVIAAGPPIGTRFRWRHILGVGTTGPDGEVEIIAVRTPHIGGSIEYYRLDGDNLRVIHSRPGYSTHRIGDRNLSTAVITDFTGDGIDDLLLPHQPQRSLGLVVRTRDGSQEVARLDLPGVLTSNLAWVRTPDGAVFVFAGTADGTVTIFEF